MADWRKLFPSSANHSLEFFPPEIVNGSPLVAPPQDIFDEEANEWRNSVIAQFIGKPPGFMTLQKILSKLWEKKGSVRIKVAGHNLFVFQFENEHIQNWILENGPWHVQHNPMILRKWEPNIGKIDFALDKLPLWFHLHNIPLDLYTRNGLSYIASAIGIPLYMDSITAAKKRLAYAKVCVEASAAIDPPEKIDIALQDGSITSIAVSIPWRPLVCRICSVFGHTDRTCSKNKARVEKVWKPKEKEIDAFTHVTETTHTATPEIEVHTTTLMNQEEAITVNENNGVIDESEHVTEVLYVSLRMIDKGKLTHHSSPKKIASSTNKFALLSEEICPPNFEIEMESSRLDEEVDETTHTNIGITNEIWEQIIENATYTPKKTRAAAKEASQVWAGLKPKKAKLAARGAKKVSLGPSTLAPKQHLVA